MIAGVIQGSFLHKHPTGAAVRPVMPQAAAGGPAAGGAIRAGQAVQMRPQPPSTAPVHQPHGTGNVFEVAPAVLRKTGPGQPLPGELRLQMERAFNTPFGSVRVHVGPQAPSIGARAFTIGTDLYFAPGQYQPQTGAGRRLIGRELAHVVQQRQGRVRNLPGSNLTIVQDHVLEAEAERMGSRAATSTTSHVVVSVRPSSPDRSARNMGRQSRSVQRMEDTSPLPYHPPPSSIEYGKRLEEALSSAESGLAEKVRRRIELAQRAISHTRSKLPFGAANITEQVKTTLGWSRDLASDIGSYSADIAVKLGNRFMSREAVESLDAFQKANASEEIRALNLAAGRAIVARKLGAGVCDDFAAVTMFFLQKEASQDEGIYKISATIEPPGSGGGAAHALIIIGDQGLDEAGLMNSPASVVVDAWPTTPFAVRTQDWVYKTKPITIKIRLQGGNYINYLKNVRAAYKEPYTFKEVATGHTKTAYRGIGDTPGSDKLYFDYMALLKEKRKNALAKFNSREPSDNTGGWTAWEDVDSLWRGK